MKQILNYCQINILFLIITCKKNNFKKNHFQKLNNSLFLIGDLNLNTKYKIIDDTLFVRASDTYLGLPEKIIMALEAFLVLPELSKYTHIYKIDDDNQIKYNQISTIKKICKKIITKEINKARNKNDKIKEQLILNSNILDKKQFVDFDLFRIIQNHSFCGQKIHRGKGSGRWHFKYKHNPAEYWNLREYKGEWTQRCDGGCGYILKRDIIHKINKIYHSNNLDILRNQEVYEDVMIGKLCYKFNCLPKKIPKDYCINIGDK